MKKALCYGLLASLFFAFTFMFNRSMNLECCFEVHIYAPDAVCDCPEAKRNENGDCRNKKTASLLDCLEYGRIWTFLYAAVNGIGLR